MSIRKRDDSIKRGCGIDGGLGEDYTKRYNAPDMDDPSVYPGQKSEERSYAGRYTSNRSGLTRTDDFEHSAVSRQIWEDVEANQNPNGEFDSTGPIKYGVNQSEAMTIRKRNDAEGWKRGEGAYTGAKPEPTKNLYERDDWNPEQRPTDPWSYPGARSKESSYAGPYTENASGLVQGEDFQSAATRDIFDDVNANSRPRGDDNYGFDATGPIKYGVNKKQ